MDEELLLWKGRLPYKQYISSKRSRYGIKLFTLCEDSGYLCNSCVYLGKGTTNNAPAALLKEVGKTGAVVVTLMEDLLGKGYHLYFDNWYTSEALLKYLQQRDTVAAVTVKKGRIKLPSSFKNAELERCEHIFRRSEDMLVVKFQDKNTIH